jgi:Rieske Fe-S protein
MSPIPLPHQPPLAPVLLYIQTNQFLQGASPKELVFEACRRDNTELLEEVLNDIRKAHKTEEEGMKAVAGLLNTAADGIGNGVLHVAATSGSCKHSGCTLWGLPHRQDRS